MPMKSYEEIEYQNYLRTTPRTQLQSIGEFICNFAMIYPIGGISYAWIFEKFGFSTFTAWAILGTLFAVFVYHVVDR